jgi:hypothetical protein
MPIFLRKIALSLMILLALAAALSVLYRASAQAAMQQALTVDPAVTVVALGDSHAQCSLDDRPFPHIRNFGESAESVVISYWKLHRLLSLNPGQIKDVLFFVSPRSLTFKVIQQWHNQPDVSDRKFLVLNEGLILPSSARDTFFFPWRKRVYLWLRYDMGVPLGVYFSSRLSVGGFGPWAGSMAATSGRPPNATESVPAAERGGAERSPLLVDHIRRLVRTGTEGGARVYLVNSPTWRVAPRLRVTAGERDKAYQSLMVELARNPMVTFLDFGDYPLAAECFGNSSHLNSKGAGVFTEHLCKEVGCYVPCSGTLPDSQRHHRIAGPYVYAALAGVALCLCVLPFSHAGAFASSRRSPPPIST